jgi:hypothetical protein
VTGTISAEGVAGQWRPAILTKEISMATSDPNRDMQTDPSNRGAEKIAPGSQDRPEHPTEGQGSEKPRGSKPSGEESDEERAK